MTDLSAQPTNDLRRALAWAAFLGASWTWVIGMFLPTLLIRDFGPAAWFIFAIPNVLGAAAMGWVMRSREHSVAFVTNHRAAAQAFSLVTIAFHVYVVLWLLPQLLGTLGATFAFVGLVIAIAPLLTTTIRATSFAIAALLASAVIAVVLAGSGALSWPAIQVGRTVAALDLIALGVVCLLGFLTCPYLDLTFHRARQACATPKESKIAFGVGFGVCFCSMIVLTLFYAGVFVSGIGGRSAMVLIGVHITLQAIFTVGVHASSFRRVTADAARSSRAVLIAIAVPAVVAMVATFLESRAWTVGPLVAGEIGYRTFLSFYGLLAPAYVWLCVRRADQPAEVGDVQIAVGSVLLAAPFFWIGFMHDSMRWAVLGVAIVVIGRIIVGTARHRAEARERSFNALGGHRP